MSEIDVEWIAKTDDVRIRHLTVSEGDATPWHRHSQVTDDVFCLEGLVAVRTKGGDTVTLAPGQRHRTPPGLVHSVANAAPGPSRYLLIQTGTPFDFLTD